MNALGILARAVLQNAGAINDRINTNEVRKPVLRIRRGCDVDNSPLSYTRMFARAARHSDDFMPLLCQPSGKRGPDEACGSRNQNVHLASSETQSINGTPLRCNCLPSGNSPLGRRHCALQHRRISANWNEGGSGLFSI
jgi:hypothetical protein